MIQEIGPHKVTNESVESPLVDAMLAGDRVSVLYSDPPWGDGNLKYWATMNRKMTGKTYSPLTYSALVSRLRGLVEKYVDGHVFIETGPRWERETVDALGGLLQSVRVYRLRYRSGNAMLSNVLIYGVTGQRHAPMAFDPTGMCGPEVPRRCIAAVASAGGIVLDPCCGMGYSAKAAVAAGMRFRGNEFNAKRLQKTIDFLKANAA
jgi:hypothetical protein